MTKAIYLGTGGAVEIERMTSDVPLVSSLGPGDVAVTARRFSFDFDEAALITGDLVTIRTLSGNNLELVVGHAFPDWTGYIHVDDAGGIRLHETFNASINGKAETALELEAPTSTEKIEIITSSRDFRYIANISDYEITTAREAVDLTSLGEQHRRSYESGLISGQGTLNCIWDYKYELCGGSYGSHLPELPQYLAMLLLRVNQGSSFHGRFYLLNGPDDYVWYDAPTCIITNVALVVNTADAVRAQIQFVTSGEIRLHVGEPPAYLLQEDLDFVLQESGEKIELEDN